MIHHLDPFSCVPKNTSPVVASPSTTSKWSTTSPPASTTDPSAAP